MELEQVKKFILTKLEKELPKNLTYHSHLHIRDVYTAAEMLAGMEGVTGEDLTLLLTAVLFHDSGFLKQETDNERISCDIAMKYLPGYGYTPEQIERICGMIMATKMPQTPRNKLEELICDADLDYLGRDDFFKIGDGLYAELRMYGILNNENEWNRLQVGFLDNHEYFTQSARKLRMDKKHENSIMVKAKLKNVL